MSIREYIEFIASHFTLEDVLYIIGKEPEWFLYRIRDELIKHREDCVVREEDYMEINYYD